MSRVVVFTFDAPGKALQARTALRDLEKRGTLALDDAVVLTKDGTGQVRRRREPYYGVLVGAAVGGLMGLLRTARLGRYPPSSWRRFFRYWISGESSGGR